MHHHLTEIKVTTTTSNFNKVFATFLKDFEKRSERGVIEFMLDVPPVPASRPRVSKWGTYYGKKYQQFMNDASNELVTYKGLKVEGPVVVFLEHVCAKPKTTKRDYPVGDVDNYAKGPLDVMTKTEKFWKDDDQVVLLTTGKRFVDPGEEPQVRIYWYELTE